MTRDLEKFLVKLAIGGINKNTDPTAEQEIDFELSMRPHILSKKILWDEREKILLVQVEVESVDENLAAKQMAEELFEVANAVLRSVQGLNVKVMKK